MSLAGEVVIAYGELLTLHDRLRESGEEMSAAHVHTAAEWLERALRALGESDAWIGGKRDAEPVLAGEHAVVHERQTNHVESDDLRPLLR